jgi:hypothetical protein
MTCILCNRDLLATNATEVCAECRLLIENLLELRIEERWRPALELDGLIVSDLGRVARLLPIDRCHRYPRVNAGAKRYVHALVTEAFHGPRPAGQVARHLDDVPTHCTANNLAWGTHADNAADAIRNGRIARRRP